MRFMKPKSLNSRGIAHYVVPLVVVVLTGLVGTYLLVASHANSGLGCSGVNSIKGTCSYGNICKPGYAPGGYGGCTKLLKSYPKAPAKTTTADQGGGASASVPVSTPASSSTDSAPVAAPINYPIVKHTGARGDIIVVSYVHVPGQQDNQRIGGLAVKVSRNGGGSDCKTHKNGKGSTSQQQYLKRKGRPDVLTHGTIHFLNCKAGEYTVTTTGRKGYSVVSSTSKSFTLNDNENQRVPFVIQKITTATTGGAAANTAR